MKSIFEKKFFRYPRTPPQAPEGVEKIFFDLAKNFTRRCIQDHGLILTR